MKILWICPFFLHPTDRGGQIRTLGTLRELHKRNEIHFAALNNPANREGPERSREYCSKHIEVAHTAPNRASLAILPQLAGAIFSPVPLAVSRYASRKLAVEVQKLMSRENYDAIVCDFLAAVPNVPDLGDAILFQHNVETTIWERHADQETSWWKRVFFRQQAAKMASYEKKVCRAVKEIIAVSDVDASRMQQMFGVGRISAVSTGVDVDELERPRATPAVADLIFSGSMDWLPNVDAMEFFLREVFPLIRERRPETTFTIAGRSPDARVLNAAKGLAGVTVTGTVSDMKPYLWGSKVSVVPIRIGGGTRLKIYECMAAGLPVVSTQVGAEGLAYTDGENIVIRDSPQGFAEACLTLLEDRDRRDAVASAALELVRSKYSWASVALEFENLLRSAVAPHSKEEYGAS